MRNLRFIVILGIFIPWMALAEGAQGFHQHFKQIRNESGQLTQLVLKTRSNKPIQQMLQSFQVQFTVMKTLNQLSDKELEKQFTWIGMDPKKTKKYLKKSKKAYKYLEEKNIIETMNETEFREVMEEFEKSLPENLSRGTVMASPGNPKFFYREAFGRLAISVGLKIAQRLGSGLGLDIATYFIRKSIRYYLHRRTFYQNTVLYYINNFAPEELGMTVLEVDQVRSSVFEARIKWYQRSNSMEARSNWDTYGNQRLLRDIAKCDARIEENREEFATRASLTHIFHERDGESRTSTEVFNFKDRRSALSKKPSLAFDSSQPYRLGQYRIAMEVLDLGISLAPVPGLGILDWFIDKTYVKQVKSEGNLMGHYMAVGQHAEAHTIGFQTANPFIWADMNM